MDEAGLGGLLGALVPGTVVGGGGRCEGREGSGGADVLGCPRLRLPVERHSPGCHSVIHSEGRIGH